jgi:Arc/MetJ-type ribon-helix-helix transcriptional regulator
MINVKDEEELKLQNITIALPEIYCENLRKLQEMGIISSRSDGIRRAIHEFLGRELSETLKLLDFDLPEDTSNKVEDNL